MIERFPSLEAESLKSLFVKEIEARILEGDLNPGDMLPPERELAAQMGVSRGIVNVGILELASKGFVEIRPRKGTVVLDYKTEGTAQILTSIMNYHGGRFDETLFHSMMDTRLLIEVECARCAAQNRTEEDLAVLKQLLKEITFHTAGSIREIEEANYQFHHRITIASGNIVFAMIFKSFEPVCKNFIRHYYQSDPNRVRRQTAAHYEELYLALENRDAAASAKAMEGILMHGTKELARLVYNKKSSGQSKRKDGGAVQTPTDASLPNSEAGHTH